MTEIIMKKSMLESNWHHLSFRNENLLSLLEASRDLEVSHRPLWLIFETISAVKATTQTYK